MRKSPLILPLLIAFAACKTTIHDSGCISRYTGPDYIANITAAQTDTAKMLFAANNLPAANYYFTYYASGPQTNFPDTTIKWYTQFIGASQLINGLPAFQFMQYWTFHNGALVPGQPIPAIPNPGSDTSGHQTLPQLRALFLKSFDTALYNNKMNYGDGRIGRPGLYYRDSCLLAQLGYIDASYQPPYTTPYGTKYLKVWRITPSGYYQPYGTAPGPYYYGRNLPAVYVDDATGYAWCTNATYPGQHVPLTFNGSL